MHEMGIACSVLEAVRTEAERRDGARVRKVGLRVGEWAGVDSASLRFCFEVLIKGSDLDPLELDIECCPRRNRCPACGRVFPLDGFETACPGCGAPDTVPAGGDELELAYLEIETP